MRHHRSQNQSRTSSTLSTLNLESYIRLETERMARSRVIVHGIRFNLDQNSLQTLLEAQQSHQRLTVSPQLLTNLRHYALLDPENHLQSGLTFATYYGQGGFPEALIRSVISADGSVLHQIKSDCLKQSDFYYQIASAHYWLIEQVLHQLRFRPSVRFRQLATVLSWVIAGAITLLLVPLLIVINPWMVLVIGLILWLLHRIFFNLLRHLIPVCRRLVLHQLLSGWLSRKPLNPRIIRMLTWLVP